MLGDAADERKGVERGGDEEFLTSAEVKADADGDLGETVELFVERKSGEGCLRLHFDGFEYVHRLFLNSLETRT